MEHTELNALLMAGLAAIEGKSALSPVVANDCDNALRLRRDGVLVLSQVVVDGIAAISHFHQYGHEVGSDEVAELLLCVNLAIQETSAS